MTQQHEPSASDNHDLLEYHSEIDRLRSHSPVHVDHALDRVVLTRSRDVAATLADRSLSSNPTRARPTAYGARALTEHDRNNISLLFLDDPDHARLRGLVAKAFTAYAVESMRPRVQTIVSALLDSVDVYRNFDLVTTFAVPLPILVIAALIGVDDVHIDQIRRWSQGLLAVFSPHRTADDQRRLVEAREGLDAYFRTMLADRHKRPRDDLISALAAAENCGETLTEAEILSTLRLLLAAGSVTTTDLVGNAVVTLLRHPKVLGELHENGDLWPAAVEELLRYDPPVMAVNRQPLSNRQIDRCPIEAGQTLTLMLVAANRDPTLHIDPHRFDIHRQNQKHFSFGGGSHFCLGASLARLELEIGLRMLFMRFPKLRLIAEALPRRKQHPVFSGYEAILLSAS